jgi:hypothetical protein
MKAAKNTKLRYYLIKLSRYYPFLTHDIISAVDEQLNGKHPQKIPKDQLQYDELRPLD